MPFDSGLLRIQTGMNITDFHGKSDLLLNCLRSPFWFSAAEALFLTMDSIMLCYILPLVLYGLVRLFFDIKDAIHRKRMERKWDEQESWRDFL